MCKIRCNNCYWTGNEEDLVRMEEEKTGETMDACPNCETDHYLMDGEFDETGKNLN